MRITIYIDKEPRVPFPLFIFVLLLLLILLLLILLMLQLLLMFLPLFQHSKEAFVNWLELQHSYNTINEVKVKCFLCLLHYGPSIQSTPVLVLIGDVIMRLVRTGRRFRRKDKY